MTGSRFEIFLARLYTDAAARSRFVEDPESSARAEGLDDNEIRAALTIDREDRAICPNGSGISLSIDEHGSRRR